MSKADTILKLLQGCNCIRRLHKIHALVITNGLQHHGAVSTKLLNFCAVSVSGSLAYAQLLFHCIDNPQTQAWNSIIRGFAKSPSPIQAILYYNDMVFALVARPDTFTFSFVLKACERVTGERKCREVHGTIIRCGYESDVVVCTNLLRTYALNGSIDLAQRVFDSLSERDLVSWNSMISCYSQAGFHHEALKVYDRMKNETTGLDGFTLVGLLSSCAHVGALNFGVHLHGIALEEGFVENIYVGNALIDMYAKCGSLDDALHVFNSMQKRDVFTWNSIIAGCGVHGRGDGAVSIFRQMLMAGVQPNSITFTGLLCGCSHQGLVEEGVEYFHMMSSKFNLKPGVKHYGCIVDLFGRAGKLEKALEIIETSPTPDDPVLWRILLGSCKIHKNVKIGETAMRNLMQLGESTGGDCILLSTIYAGAKDTAGVSKMRKLIKSQGMKTTPGWSWIEVGDRIHKFVVDDKSHPGYNEIYHKLREVIHQATLFGYVPEESFINVAGLITEECLETSTSYHSEKLAIAFGLAKTSKGTPLRIVKNLRVCRDCHSFTKYISRAFNREIIVRDRVRFHHFKGGLCSCKDYW
ncbi:pentatricopeptide repeat-containing protein At3g56550 [Juglans microcarpa x Juglans regia]|uniref:pentatricopeptide repeat-containing protein At3g56550 n=1 Tax=Juglans microcarpa x Juglans regia TaxID=2249226 RepID=UPI001B7E6C3C|nr:pentatricopeptide repeat-containing protein At3g56550 [Juglans microcarpa x Juglans regia]